jgi:serine phosphatase RsbU (regulator of sigma subunit)
MKLRTRLTLAFVLISAVPLGSMSRYRYKERQVNLAPGDTVLLMSA